MKTKTINQIIENNIQNYNDSEIYRCKLLKLARKNNTKLNTKPRILTFSDSILNDADGIEIGYDYKTGGKVIFPSIDLWKGILNTGNPGTGKSVFELMFIYELYYHTKDVCSIFLDNKGEIAESLSHFNDKTETALKKKIIELKPDQIANMYDKFANDTIIIIDLSDANESLYEYLTALHSVLKEIRKAMLEFKKIYKKSSSEDFPYSVLMFLEDAFEMFPGMNSTIMRDRFILNKAFDVQRKAYYEKAKKYLKEDDDFQADHCFKKAKEVPDLVEISYAINILMQKNIQLFACLDFGCFINIHRFQDIDGNFVANCQTWIIHDMNHNDHRTLKSNPKIDSKLVEEYFKIAQDERKKHSSSEKDSFMKYCLVLSPSIQAIVEKPKHVLFHKSKRKKLKRRTDIKGMRKLV